MRMGMGTGMGQPRGCLWGHSQSPPHHTPMGSEVPPLSQERKINHDAFTKLVVFTGIFSVERFFWCSIMDKVDKLN